MRCAQASNTVVFPLPKRFRQLHTLKVMCLWQIVWTLWCQIRNDFLHDPDQSWPYLPHHRVMRTQLELIWRTDNIGRQFCFRDVTIGWPWPIGDMVAYFCRLARFTTRLTCSAEIIPRLCTPRVNSRCMMCFIDTGPHIHANPPQPVSGLDHIQYQYSTLNNYHPWSPNYMPQFKAQDMRDLEEVTRQWSSTVPSAAGSMITRVSGDPVDATPTEHAGTNAQITPDQPSNESSDRPRRRRDRRRHRCGPCYHFHLHISRSRFSTYL